LRRNIGILAVVSAFTNIDPTLAASLGFRRPEYTAVERERRWLADGVPRDQIRQTLTVVDLYVNGTRLRLRDMRPIDGGPPLRRLSRKADVDARTRLITSIYLPEEEFAVLAAALVGRRITKTRHRLHAPPGILLSVDEFDGALAGLVLVEAEFQTDEALAAFSAPSFAVREVTDDPEYTGGWLAHHGRPRESAR
jgi:CYTH domain-containing protein